jgi:AAA domain
LTVGQSAPEYSATEALCAIGTLFELGDVIEIRALDVGRTPDRAGNTYAGYFNFENSDAISAAIRSVDGRAEGVYVTLHRINSDLLTRSNNRLKIKPKNTTSDADVIEFRWLYIDADAIRPAGISATDAEHEAALQLIATIKDYLTQCGWPDPVHGDSGNGGHLLYRMPKLDLKCAGDLIKGCLRTLSARFSNPAAKVDEATANPARICKLYGTMARKGDSTPDRPHRRSALLGTPERIESVPLAALEALAAEIVTAAPPAKRILSAPGGFDIGRWLDENGFEIIKGPEQYDGGRRWTLRSCRFNPQHEKPVVIELPGGALVYRCLHKSCAQNDWKALRRLIEPNYREWTQRPGEPRLNSGDLAAGPGASDDARPRITDLSQIPSVFSIESQLNWCVDGMIAQGSVTLICAESGTGKTWLGYYLAGCIARGVPVLGYAVRCSPVLYLDGENPVYVVKQRLSDLGIEETTNLTVWGGWNISPPVGPDDPLVIEFARQNKGVIVYDSLIEFHPGSEQSSTETRAFMRFFRTLANLGATVIILHHTGKAESSKQYRGSSDIKAAVDTAYLLTPNSSDSDGLRDLSMNCFKARLAPPQHFGMEFKKGHGFVRREAFKPTRNATEIIAEILAENPNINQTKIVQLGSAAGCTKRQIEDNLRSGEWGRSPGPKNSTLYSLPAQGAESSDARD